MAALTNTYQLRVGQQLQLAGKKATVENITTHGTDVYVNFSSIAQLGGRSFSSLRLEEFLARWAALAGSLPS